MAGLTASGVGSGLDISGLVSQLVTAERTPVDNRLSAKESTIKAKLSAYGSLKSAISDFQTALGKLKSDSVFQGRTITLSNDKLVKVTAEADSAQASYSLVVESRAEKQKLASAAYAGGASTVIGAGSLTIGAGDKSFSVSVDGTSGTLAGIRDAINKSTDNPGVTASLVNTTEGTRLVLTAAKTGEANVLTLSGTGALTQFDYTAGASGNAMTEQVAASDARIVLDGFVLESSDNTFKNAVEGLTIDVLKADVGETVTVEVARDTSVSRKSVEDFVAAYNKLQSKLSSLTSYDAASSKAGELLGDSVARTLSSTLRNEINTALDGVSANFDTLSELGITTNAKSGQLEINSTKLDKVLAENHDAIADFFSGSDGMSARLSASLDRFVKSDGLIQGRTDSLNSQSKDVTRQREAHELRMEQLQARYTAQFTALDTLLSGLSSTSSFLTSQLSLLSK